MLCPSCGHQHDRVVDSRPAREGAAIRRRRECLDCSARYTTYEYVERGDALVVKRDGRRVPYDREKIVTGVLTACQKRPLSRDDIDNLVERVEQKIFSKARDELPSVEVGEAVMDELQQLDDIAYVRFASVYRSFRNVEHFMQELRGLLDRQETDDGDVK